MRMVQAITLLLYILPLASPASGAANKAPSKSSSESPASTAPTRFAAGRPVDCLHIKLELAVDVPKKHVDGVASLQLQALRSVESVVLDAHDFEVHQVQVALDGQPLKPAEYDNNGDSIEVFLDRSLDSGGEASVVIQYSVDDPDDGLTFFAPSEDEPDVPFLVWSQGEAETNSYWFPCFDHPNERQSTELIVTTDSKFQVSSNGELIERKEDAKAKQVTYHWLQDKPHVAYLVSMIVGEFHIERDTWRGKPVEYWAHPRFKDDVSRSFANTKRMLDFFSDKIGIEYPWHRYAQICCEGFGGGMENTSATTLGNRALHDARSILDGNSDGLIAHELAHQWWGDLLTCRDWAHLWLNEGFASYFEALWAEHDLGDDEFRYNMYRKARGAISGGKERPVVDRRYSSPGSMFDSRAYPKGAWILHMIRCSLGDDIFWQVLNRYGTQHANSTVETYDLRKAIEEHTGKSFERFFYDWTGRPGNPDITVTYKWLSQDGLAEVLVEQKQDADAFHFPLVIEFGFEGRDPITFKRDIKEKELRFFLPLPQRPRLVRIDPNQEVLMDLTEEKSKQLWTNQLGSDPNPVARIRAADHFADSSDVQDHKLLAAALGTEPFWAVQKAIAEALADVGGEIARDALIKGLTFQNNKARRVCIEQLAAFTDDAEVTKAIRPLAASGDPSYSAESAALETYAALGADDAYEVLVGALDRDSRSEVLRRSALVGLGELDSAEAADVLIEWTKKSKPRLCRPSALWALSSLIKDADLDEEMMQKVQEALEACLDDSGSRVRMAAVTAMGSFTSADKAMIKQIEEIAKDDENSRVRRVAERSLKALRKEQPMPDQLAELREELAETKERNEDLSERLSKLEANTTRGETTRSKRAAVGTPPLGGPS